MTAPSAQLPEEVEITCFLGHLQYLWEQIPEEGLSPKQALVANHLFGAGLLADCILEELKKGDSSRLADMMARAYQHLDKAMQVEGVLREP